MHNPNHIAIAIAGLLLVATGCHLRPDWGPPGTIGMQRDRAVLHDPFPSNDLGPTIVGGRPKGFDIPRAEAVDRQDNPFSHISLRNPNLLRRSQGSFPGLTAPGFQQAPVQQRVFPPNAFPQSTFQPDTFQQPVPQGSFSQAPIPRAPLQQPFQQATLQRTQTQLGSYPYPAGSSSRAPFP